MVRIILVGLGGCGRHWVKNIYPQQQEAQLVAYVDASPESLLRARQDLALPEELCFGSLEQALEQVGCDAVQIATTLPTHIPLALTALRAGKHVLLEKPFAPTLEEAREAIAVAEQQGKLLMINQNYRYSAAVYQVKQLIQDAYFGPVGTVAVDFRRYANAAPRGSNRHYELWQPLLVDMAIHHFDLMRFILDQEPQSISCQTWNPPYSNFVEPPAGSALIQFDGGAVVSYRGSWVSTAPETTWSGDWRLECLEGVISWRSRGYDQADEVIIQPRGKKPLALKVDALAFEDWGGSLQAFVQALQTGTEPACAARHNIHTLAFMLAAVESSTSGKVVQVQAGPETM
ncbi:Gfo/Idh/MocA family protein [Dictyobacter kobayashii]|uniref:Oxidoreductase n=1 Tax=Dictyobacter kobayashii TaxID=2014872 RepID=A0A402AXY6_9CHLR|nr:Gfo/Idh/MocA family oxidoreductase [Dictyobacter kobayashii]GCE23966.1 oxidoreductase [Dictyobacter kobayashii]